MPFMVSSFIDFMLSHWYSIDRLLNDERYDEMKGIPDAH